MCVSAAVGEFGQQGVALSHSLNPSSGSINTVEVKDLLKKSSEIFPMLAVNIRETIPYVHIESNTPKPVIAVNQLRSTVK